MKKYLPIIIGLWITVATSSSQAHEQSPNLEKLTNQFFSIIYKFNPSQGTADGFHQYDNQLENYSLRSINQQSADLEKLVNNLQKIDSSKFLLDEQIDLKLMFNYAQAQLLNLQQIKMWQKNPQFYTDLVSNDLFQLASRDFAPKTVRLRAVIDREKQMPELLKQAEQNLNNPPKIFCSLTLESLPGVIDFVTNDLPIAFSDVKDKKLLERFKLSNDQLKLALHNYQIFIEQQLLPKAPDNFALGKSSFEKMLRYNEGVDIQIEKLLQMGFDDLRKNQRALSVICKKINPQVKEQVVIDALFKKHPTRDNLIPAFKKQVELIKQFIVKNNIVTVISAKDPLFIETPSFAASLTFAAMETPGPYDKHGVESFFEITLPDKNWSSAQTQEYLSGFNISSIVTTAAHEVYPGHYLQYLYLNHLSSKVRKLIGAQSNSEGWAHYCEQMVLDEGYGANDLDLRLGQIIDALLRDARFIVSIKMHTQNMTLKQATNFFEKQAHLSKTNALMEAKRGTNDPLYLSYTLGKLQILALRDELKARDKEFTLKKFHDQFLAQGYPPIAFVRQILLRPS